MTRNFQINSDLSPNSSTLVELLRRRAANQPDQIGYIYLVDGETEEVRMTYEALDQKARAIGAWLQSRGMSGERALLLYPPGLDFIAAFFGCLYAGVVAAPAYPPRLNRPTPRIQAIVADARATIALTTTKILGDIERRFEHAPDLASLRWLNTEDLPADLESEWREPNIAAEELAFLQYTSGSTSAPKGVMLSHGNLMHNLEVIGHGFQIDNKAMGVFWLPSYHDLGLIGGILEPLYIAGPTVLMSPASFLQRPARWLQAITRYKGTVSGAPNFAYALCVEKITPEVRATLDLSSWRVAFCGAEPIRQETLERFAETFEPCGFRPQAFYPCYGLAEATLLVAGGDGPGLPILRTIRRGSLEKNRAVPAVTGDEDAQTLVSSGHALLDQEIAIVDPEDLTRSPPGQVGEIWVSGASVSPGYWGNPRETERTLQASLADTGEGPFLRTGDLGFLLDGELFVTGRLKDLIIIRGRNHYPQDIERTVELSHQALQPGAGAVFSIEVSDEERLVIVHELARQHRNADVDEVIPDVRWAVAEQYELQAYAVVLVRPLSLPKTSSGKIQRYVCKERFLEGSLKVRGEWQAHIPKHNDDGERAASTDGGRPTGQVDAPPNFPTAPTIATWLMTHIAAQLGINPADVDTRQPFTYYGLDSVHAVSLTGELEIWLGRSLSPTLAWDYPTIETLAQHLASKSPPRQSLVASHRSERPVTTEPIAIIGIGCRFPGADSPEAFWELLRDGVDAIREVPADRWDVEAFYDPDPDTPGKMYTRWGGFLEDVDKFDFQFFGIAPREAVSMDPQQRLLLEVSWEALENAGQAPDRLVGSPTGVFVGIGTNDYSLLQARSSDLTDIDAYTGTGSAFSVAAGRLSYVLGLQGPSLAIDTACSSSLVTVHLACQSLNAGECNLALAGGVNLILSPEASIYLCELRAMAADGRCKTFDAAGDGYVRGEGCGLVVLKRLSDAVADGDDILAVIRGSAINHDGRSNGLTAPNGLAQQVVIRKALANANVVPAEVSYVETHGTGTELGDPIEVKALGAVLSDGRGSDQRLAIGSVKTNVGHLEAAAGIVGLIKVVLALQHKQIPPHLHLREVNPYIPMEELAVEIPTEPTPWPAGDGGRIAGLSAFGFSGTNAHMILQEAAQLPAPELGDEASESDKVRVLPLSARSPEALQAMARTYRDFLAVSVSEPATRLRDICYTASVRRGHHDYRLALTGHSPEALVEQLEAFLLGETLPGMSSGQKPPSRRRQLVFVFPGQGGQWWAMGRRLLENEPVFRSTIERCDTLLGAYTNWSLMAELTAEEAHSRLDSDNIEITQIVIFSMQVGLAALWRSWGIVPDAVVGHSMGEVAAAHVAGALSLEDAIRVMFHRSNLLQEVTGEGKMAAVELSLLAAQQALAGYEDRLSIAGHNSPTSTVLSGDPAALDEVLETLQQQDIFCRALRTTGVAGHSPQLEPLKNELAQALHGIQPRPATLSIFSTVTGQASDGAAFDAAYWARNIRDPVLFSAAINELVDKGHDIFLELGPHPVLAGAISACLSHREQEGVVLATLRREEEDEAVMLASLAALYTLGHPLDWSRQYPVGGRHVRIPSYPWQRERCWLETAEMPDLIGERPGRDGRRVRIEDLDDWLYELQWQPQARVPERHDAEQPASIGQATWLIFADSGGVGEALASRMTAQGTRCVLIFPGEAYERVDQERFLIHPDRAEDLRQLFENALPEDQPACRGIVHLWSLDAPHPEAATSVSLERAQTLGCGSVLNLLQELVREFWPQAPRLWLVTQGAQPVNEGAPIPLQIAQAPLWGFGSVIAIEHPAIWGGLVDLDPSASEVQNAASLQEVVSSPNGEDQLAFRQRICYTARLVRIDGSSVAARPIRWRRDGSYLITGGLGELGLQIARWMVAQGARRLILLGRTPLPPRADWSQVESGSRLAEQIASVRELEALGASVHLASVDVADETQLAAFLETFRREAWPPIRGVVHAAGVVEIQPLVGLDAAALQKVLRPKVAGSWLLQRLLADTELDFFVLFSSGAVLLNSPLLGSYAAANAFLDALAHYRRAQGQHALSVNWGYWAETGMAARFMREAGRESASRGMRTFTPAQGLEVLRQLLRTDAVQAAVMPINWDEWIQFHPATSKSPLLADLVSEATDGSLTSRAAKDGLTRDAFFSAPSKERYDLLESYLRKQIARKMGLSASKMDVQQPLTNMGIDSLMAIEVKNQVEAELHVVVPAVQFLQGPTIAQLAEQLLKQLTEPAPGASRRTASAVVSLQVTNPEGRGDLSTSISVEEAGKLLANLDQLSDREVEALLKDLLAEEEYE